MIIERLQRKCDLTWDVSECQAVHAALVFPWSSMRRSYVHLKSYISRENRRATRSPILRSKGCCWHNTMTQVRSLKGWKQLSNKVIKTNKSFFSHLTFSFLSKDSVLCGSKATMNFIKSTTERVSDEMQDEMTIADSWNNAMEIKYCMHTYRQECMYEVCLYLWERLIPHHDKVMLLPLISHQRTKPRLLGHPAT